MKLKVITSVAIEKDGKFLILKRSSYDTLPGMWEFPGGKVKPVAIL
ncbi:MAG: NUDIX domain-containing protein [Candidatus Aenigmatarchaeota archaeon]|nr:NUDIX domain-containing protein [Candidatus Aenigmarchaeota archaeon]